MQASSALGLIPLLFSACTSSDSSIRSSSAHGGLVAANGSTLFASLPELDGRIVGLAPTPTTQEEVTPVRRFYPDQWNPELRGVRDFLVAEDSLYALVATDDSPHAAWLQRVSKRDGRPQSLLLLSPRAQRLAWADPNALLIVAHATPAQGPPGRLSLVDTRQFAVQGTVELAGACRSVVAAGERAYAVEQLQRRVDHGTPVTAFNLVEIDLRQRRVTRRMALPAGAGELILGPSGLLYIGQSSALGLHATDGTVSILDPHDLQLVGRLRFGMTVRQIAASDELLIFNLLTPSGQSWLAVVDRDHR